MKLDKLQKKLLGAWVVPPITLLSYTYPIITQQIDQTVWEITEINNYYVFGDCYSSVGGKLSFKKIIGSITPKGDGLFTFYNADDINDSIIGFGKFAKNKIPICNQKHKYVFTMQMSSTLVQHWSYMIKVNPNEPLYNHLPGIGISVPDFKKEVLQSLT